MLDQLGDIGQTELKCGSHVSRILTKLPHHLRADFKRHIDPFKIPISTLLHLSNWLEYKVRVQEDRSQFSNSTSKDRPVTRKEQAWDLRHKSTFVLHGSEQKQMDKKPVNREVWGNTREPIKRCPFCNTPQHFLNQCTNFKILTKGTNNWTYSNKKYWKCGRDHLSLIIITMHFKGKM